MTVARVIRKATLPALSLLFAFCLEWVLDVRWWHPYCDTQYDGPGYFAYGFPLPHSIPAPVSLESAISIPAYVVDVLLLAIPAYFLFLAISRVLKRWGPKWVYALAGFSFGLLLPVAAMHGFVMSLGVASTAFSSEYDEYWSLRPWFLAKLTDHKPCDSKHIYY